jgi:hypothetical protein
MQKIDLNTANLTKANLKDSKLTYSNLSTANLIKADLSSADLVGVNLSYAKLEGANLSDAILIGADLSNAYLMGSDLSGAYLAGANLRGVLFEPKPGSLPNIEAAAEAANLHKLSYRSSPRALVQLRDAFKQAGFRYQERQITFAIKSKDLNGGGLWICHSMSSLNLQQTGECHPTVR